MSWIMVGGAAAGAVSGIAGQNEANADIEGSNVGAQNTANNAYALAMNQQRSGVAQTQNAWTQLQWQQGNANALFQGQTAQGMFGSKYGIAQNQANYDSLQKEFGDMADNVAQHFKSLSPSSMKAQNNERFNLAYANEMQGLSQQLTERGIDPGSGMALALRSMAGMQTETGKIQANRNVETDIAMAQSNFMGSAATNPLYGARPIDFSEGILNAGELSQLAPTSSSDISGMTPETWDPYKADVKLQSEMSGGGILGAIGGALGGLFG